MIFRRVQGEAGQVNLEALQHWQRTVLRRELELFSPEDIYNVDETGLFFQLLPNKTLAFRGKTFYVSFLPPSLIPSPSTLSSKRCGAYALLS